MIGILDTGYWILDSGFTLLDLKGFRILDSKGYWILDSDGCETLRDALCCSAVLPSNLKGFAFISVVVRAALFPVGPGQPPDIAMGKIQGLNLIPESL